MSLDLNEVVRLLAAGNIPSPRLEARILLEHIGGSPFAEPGIELGSGPQLFFSFDDLSSETNSYTYKIVHCFHQKRFHYIYHIVLQWSHDEISL